MIYNKDIVNNSGSSQALLAKNRDISKKPSTVNFQIQQFSPIVMKKEDEMKLYNKRRPFYQTKLNVDSGLNLKLN